MWLDIGIPGHIGSKHPTKEARKGNQAKTRQQEDRGPVVTEEGDVSGAMRGHWTIARAQGHKDWMCLLGLGRGSHV